MLVDYRKNYYEILGIDVESTESEIKTAYRKLARKYHPDVNQGNQLSIEKFKEITEAYEILTDKNSKKQYDFMKGFDFAKADNTKQAQKMAQDAYKQAKPGKAASSSTDTQDKSFNDVFSDFLDGIFKKTDEPKTQQPKEKPQQRPQENRPKTIKGDDISTDVTISITEAHNGTVRDLNVLHTIPCTKCSGQKTCPACGGKGETSQHKKISVKIPANVKEGSKIKIPNEGSKGLNGGENGDLFLLIHIQKQSIFKYEGTNVLCEIPITPSEAALGAEIEIPAIDGVLTMKIPSETQAGQKLRLTGQGILDSKTKQKGDFIVTIKIEMPKKLSDREKELYKELANERKFNPRENIGLETAKNG